MTEIQAMIDSVVAGEDSTMVLEKIVSKGGVDIDDENIYLDHTKGYDTDDKALGAIAASIGLKKYGKKGMADRQKAGRG